MKSNLSIINELKNQDSQKVLAAIENYRKNGNLATLPQFIEIVLLSEHPEIVEKGSKVLYDIKEEGAVHVIFECFKNDKLNNKHSQLTAILWEAGMDCQDRLEELVDIALQGDTNTVLEVLTVIENIDKSYPFDQITDLKLSIAEITEEITDATKLQLLNSLSLVLDGMVE